MLAYYLGRSHQRAEKQGAIGAGEEITASRRSVQRSSRRYIAGFEKRAIQKSGCGQT